jgi:hypothetical protein
VSLSGSFDEDEGFGEDEGCAFNIDESTLDNSSSIEPRKDLINEADEKALIVKNYRLAKELSDLKTKHREEAKAVTRLTMENVSCASLCHEARKTKTHPIPILSHLLVFPWLTCNVIDESCSSHARSHGTNCSIEARVAPSAKEN